MLHGVMSRVRVAFELGVFDNRKPALDALIDCMAQALSEICVISPDLVIKKGNLTASYDAVMALQHNRIGTVCRNCGTQTQCSVLCKNCKPLACRIVRSKKVVEIMYEQSNPAYAITEHRLRRILQLEEWKGFAMDAHNLSISLLRVACFVLQSNDRSNVFVNPDLDASLWIPYSKCIVYAPGFRAGGIGNFIRIEVIGRIRQWLSKLDRLFQTVFEIDSSCSSEEKLRIERIHVDIASRIASIVSMVKEPRSEYELDCGCGEPSLISVLEHHNRCEYVRCEASALRKRNMDLNSISALFDIARDGCYNVKGALHIQHREKILKTLLNPPPELILASSDFLCWNMSELISALRDEGETIHMEVRYNVIEAWRNNAGTGANVCLCCQRAIQSILNAGTPSSASHFEMVLRKCKANGRCVRIPAPSWTNTETRWEHADPARLSKRRIELDAAGKRIVFVSSAVWQIMGEHDCCEFAPGVLSADMVRAIASLEAEMAAHTIRRISVDTESQEVGLEYERTKRVLIEHKSSHVHDDMSSVMCNFSNFSISEIFTAMHEKSPLYGAVMPRLMRSTMEKLVVRPNNGNYTSFVCLLLPILRMLIVDWRLSTVGDFRGIPYAIGDVLRTIPLVGEWTACHGPLQISAGELRHAPEKARLLLKQMSKMQDHGLFYYTRVGSQMMYVFDTSALQIVLGPSSCMPTDTRAR